MYTYYLYATLKKKTKKTHKNNLCVAFLTLYSPCRRNLDHHLGSLQSDLGSIGLLVLNLRSIDNHLTGHRNTLLLAILTFPAISFHYCDLSSEKKKKRLCWIAAKFFCHFLFYFPRSFFFSNCCTISLCISVALLTSVQDYH